MVPLLPVYDKSEEKIWDAYFLLRTNTMPPCFVSLLDTLGYCRFQVFLCYWNRYITHWTVYLSCISLHIIYRKNESLNVHINDIYLYILNNFHVNKFTFERKIFARSGHRDCWFRDFDQPSPLLWVSWLWSLQVEQFPQLLWSWSTVWGLLATREGRNHTLENFEPAPVLSIT